MALVFCGALPLAAVRYSHTYHMTFCGKYLIRLARIEGSSKTAGSGRCQIESVSAGLRQVVEGHDGGTPKCWSYYAGYLRYC